MSRDYSEVVKIDPRDLSRKLIWDGREDAVHTRIRGKRRRLRGAGLAIASPRQGRAFETNAAVQVVFARLNRKPGDAAWTRVPAERNWSPEDYPDPEAMRRPSP